jgi:hypothetical protein
MAEPTPNPPAVTPEPIPAPQTFSADYVNTLRSESKGYRQRAKAAEESLSAVRTAFGLKQNEDIGDIAERLTQRDAQALSKANERLIAAELHSLAGYDQALLAKVIDLTGVKVSDDGTVKGIKEAAEAAAKAFPAVKAQTQQPWVPQNPALGDGETKTTAVNDWLRS